MFRVACVSLFFLFSCIQISMLKLWAEGLIGIENIFYFIINNRII